LNSIYLVGNPGRSLAYNPSACVDLLLIFLCEKTSQWIIEGDTADVLSVAIQKATTLIFLRPTPELRRERAKAAQWRPEIFATQECQKNYLTTFINTLDQYETNTDPIHSLSAHSRLYEHFTGRKWEIYESSSIEKPQIRDAHG
jgi:hypothetical protein